MKTLSISALGMLLILATQVFAQRFTFLEPDIFETGYGSPDADVGYLSYHHQASALGEKNSLYSDLMLVKGRDTVRYSSDKEKRTSYKAIDSHVNEFGNIYPIPLNSAPYSFINSAKDTIYDNKIGAVVVLDSFSDNKKTAIVLFATLKRLIIAELKINIYNSLEHSILKNIDMPESAIQADDNYEYAGMYRRLTLLGISKEGNDRVFHIATSNPNYKSGTYSKSGRVDFFSIRENIWNITQPNTKGITSGDGYFFFGNTAFGTDLVSVGDLDGNGYNDLAVLLPASDQFPNGAIYIYFMDNEYTPSSKSPVIVSGTSMPWKEPIHEKFSQDCRGMSFAVWKNEPHLLLSCNVTYSEKTSSYYDYRELLIVIKDIILESSGNIANTNILSVEERTTTGPMSFHTRTNPIPIKNHENGNFFVALPIQGPCTVCSKGSIYVYQVSDADASKNFSIEAGKKESLINIDSLFYNSGTKNYSSKTLAGLAKCSINASELLCEAGNEARGSWSIVELSSNTNCDQFRVCKKKDTIYVYARTLSEAANTALRIPKDIVLEMQGGAYSIENINSLAYFRNYENLSTSISWGYSVLKSSIISPSSTNDLFSIIPLPNEGIDTVIFNLSVYNSENKYPVRFHIADSSRILDNKIPAIPGKDTIWNTAKKKYIALPLSNSNGNIYTYDINQDSLGIYAEILGDYLHILRVDVAEIYIAYTENSEIKYRKIILMPEDKALMPSSSSVAETPSSSSQEDLEIDLEIEPPSSEPNSIFTTSLKQNLNAAYIGGGLRIGGLNGEFELRAYNFKGEEIQRGKASAKGFAFVKLKQNCPQIVQIKTANEKIYIKIAN